MARFVNPGPKCHCISVVTSCEAEEAVAELLERRLKQLPSVWSDPEMRVAVVSSYSTLDRGRLRDLRSALRAEVLALSRFGLDVGPGKVSVKQVKPRDWSESWKRHFKPMEFGLALLVKPTWSRRKPVSGQELVLLDPGLSFGTGQHATTRFCLEQIVALRTPGKAASICDMGTGSGILAIAAAKLGFRPVECFDFDPDCVRIAGENSELNGVSAVVRVRQGDVTRLPKRPERQFDVVCANLIYDLLLTERDRILSRVKPGGVLVLAGILDTQFERVATAYREAGATLITATTEKEWRSGAFRIPLGRK